MHFYMQRRPEFVVREKEKNALLMETAVPGDLRVEEKEEKKVMK